MICLNTRCQKAVKNQIRERWLWVSSLRDVTYFTYNSPGRILAFSILNNVKRKEKKKKIL